MLFFWWSSGMVWTRMYHVQCLSSSNYAFRFVVYFDIAAVGGRPQQQIMTLLSAAAAAGMSVVVDQSSHSWNHHHYHAPRPVQCMCFSHVVSRVFVWLPSHFQSSVLDVSAVSSGVCEDSWRSSWSWWDQQETWAERWQSSSWRQGRHDEESEEEEVAGATAAVSGAAVAPAAAASGAAAAAASGAAAWLADESPGGPSAAAEERQSQRRSDVSGRWSDVSGRWRNVSAGGAASSAAEPSGLSQPTPTPGGAGSSAAGPSRPSPPPPPPPPFPPALPIGSLVYMENLPANLTQQWAMTLQNLNETIRAEPAMPWSWGFFFFCNAARTNHPKSWPRRNWIGRRSCWDPFSTTTGVTCTGVSTAPRRQAFEAFSLNDG